MLWSIISLKSCKTVLRHTNQKENIVLKNHMTFWEPLIIYITASKSSLESFGGKSVTLVMTNSSTHSCFVSVSLCRTIEQVLQGWVLKSIVRWAVFFLLIIHSFWTKQTFKQPLTNSSSLSSPSLSISSWLNTIFAFFSAVSWKNTALMGLTPISKLIEWHYANTLWDIISYISLCSGKVILFETRWP